jgi:uncharacterized protein YgbK (DUF1537 family)
METPRDRECASDRSAVNDDAAIAGAGIQAMSRSPGETLLGVIADDFTGATDIASMLARGGLRTVMVIGVPAGPLPAADAIVVALKSRTARVAQAVEQSLAALRALQSAHAHRFIFKVCSTFDSTPEGNIGPVADALMDALDTDLALVCPAFPENGRTVFRGHLFVADELLSDSGMRSHPLTPMTDANLVRVLQAQSRRRVGLLRHDTVAAGATAVRSRIAELLAQGVGLVIADAIDDPALRVLGDVGADWPLLVAGSGLALGLPAAYAERGWVTPAVGADQLDPLPGPAAIVSGSCSQATRGQVARWREAGAAARAIDCRALCQSAEAADAVVDAALAWARETLPRRPLLIHAGVEPVQLAALQAEFGVDRAGVAVEQALARIAVGLVDAGVSRLVVAGGETSGAVVQALGVQSLRIGPAICPGVPWTQCADRPLWLALKSGNFGGPDFFAQALALAAAIDDAPGN